MLFDQTTSSLESPFHFKKPKSEMIEKDFFDKDTFCWHAFWGDNQLIIFYSGPF